MKTARRKAAQGFTLIELMVSLAAGMVLLAPLYIVTRGMSQQTDSQRMDTESMQRARIGLSLLLEDLHRTGLYVSPNSRTDPRSQNRDIPGSSAANRLAVVHLNRGVGGSDALVLSGNFLGSRSYRGEVTGAETIRITETIPQADCVRQFDSGYAFAHVIGASGDAIDARVQTIAAGVCTVTLRSGDLTGQTAFSIGENVWIAANQSVVYFVENVAGADDTHRELVRYFIDYDGGGAGGTCALGGAVTMATVQGPLPASSTVIANTRQVIARYVEDFQVWFRTARVVPGGALGNLYPPSSYSPDLVKGENEDNFLLGFVLDEQEHILPDAVDGAMPAPGTALSCAAALVRGPEHVRSAVVRLSVRTERVANQLQIGANSFTAGDRYVSMTIHEYDTGADLPLERPGSAYKLSTLTTEIMMPNLASRVDILDAENP